MWEKTSLALIVPCYNEADSIPLFETELANLYRLFSSKFPASQISVIVVDNNSSDGSEELLTALPERLPFVRVERCLEQGYGAALKHGFNLADGEYIGFLDLDNTYPMVQLIDLLGLIQLNKLDIVYGARLHPKSEIEFVRKAGNIFFVFLMKVFFNSPLSDVCSGMRIFHCSKKSEVLALNRNDLSFSIQFTAHVLLKRWKVAELAIHYRDRVGYSKLSVIKDGFTFLAVVMDKVFRKQ